jgi:hypothetical protein
MGEANLERGVEFNYILNHARHANLAQVFSRGNDNDTQIDERGH